MVEAHLVKPHDISSQDGAALEQMRPDTPCYQGPFFCLELARQVAKVRSDTRVVILRNADGFAGYWPLHVRPDGWAQPLGGPFSDLHGPVLRTDIAGKLVFSHTAPVLPDLANPARPVPTLER